eukprot:scaffold2657_cov89-Amphora_coffeaeformis.AAC.16
MPYVQRHKIRVSVSLFKKTNKQNVHDERSENNNVLENGKTAHLNGTGQAKGLFRGVKILIKHVNCANDEKRD